MRAHERLATLAEVEHGLVGVLTRLVADPSRWIVIMEVAGTQNRYVQFLMPESGSLVAEVVSNVNLCEAESLSPKDEAVLRSVGWHEPVLPDHPNYWVVHRPPDVDVAAVVAAISDALRTVFGLGDEDLLRIKMFPSGRPAAA